MIDFHPNTPKKLFVALNQIGSQRKLSKKLDVNISYISNLLRDGIEPTDKTEKGRVVRVKLFLPRWKSKKSSRPKRISEMSIKELLYALSNRQPMP